jgi:hypothetical protein
VLDINKAVELFPGLLLNHASAKRDKKLNREILRNGMCMLLECHKSLASAYYAEHSTYKKAIACLQALDPHPKQSLYKVLGFLVDCDN